MTQYTQSDKRNAARLYKEKKWGYLRISQVIGCSRTTVRDWILEAEIKPRPAPGHKKKFRTKVMNEYARREDLSLKKVAKKNGIGEATLSRWLSNAKKNTRPQRPRIVDRDAIMEDIEAGLPKAEIADRNHCSVSWVYQVQRGDG
jgi:transposase-like protein